MRLLVTITIFFIYLFHSHAFAQAGLSRITLKNGTEIKGVVKSIHKRTTLRTLCADDITLMKISL